MSYDLLFVPDPQVTAGRSLAWFRDRPYYTVENAQAIYENPDTGVYWILEGVEDQFEDEPAAWLQLNLNLFRPHYFALEAAEEIALLVEATGSLVYDPQRPDPGAAPFSASAFVECYKDADRKAYTAVLTSDDPEARVPFPESLPTDELEGIWRWNRSRVARNEQLGEDVFVPRISFLKHKGPVTTTAVWGDGIPVHLPRVDQIVVYRDQIRKRRWIRDRGEPDMALISWGDLIAHLPGQSVHEGPFPYLDLSRLRQNDSVIAYLRSQPAMAAQPTLVAADAVLNREWLPNASGRKQ